MWKACALIALLGACDPAPPRFEVVHERLPQALVSVWGWSARDVYAVGGDVGDGTGPLVLAREGEGFRRLLTGARGDLWWVFGFDGGPVFMGGAGGLILRYAGGRFERMQTPGTRTVFGIWGSAPSDLWAVGGSGSGDGFVWRSDGAVWRAAEGLPAAAGQASMFKVWGRAADDVWIVGSSGVVIHHDGARFSEEVSGTRRTLFTVHGSGARIAAVGGAGGGVVLERGASGWQDLAPAGSKQVIGVHLSGEGGYAVGANGQVLRRHADAWRVEPTGLDVFSDLHAVWMDGEGGIWAVGGQVAALPLIDGVMLYKGPRPPGRAIR